MRKLGVAVVVGLALVLTGCSGSTTYSSAEALADAFVEAGGECPTPQVIDESMLGEGAQGVLCQESATFLTVFDSADAKDRYLAETGDSQLVRFGGNHWIAAGQDESILGKLGGSRIN